MEESVKIEIGQGDPPYDCNSNNTLPIDMKLCADARRGGGVSLLYEDCHRH